MRTIILGVLAGAVLIIGITLAAPFFVSAALIETQLSDAVRKATGRTLSTSGDARFSILPTLGAEFGPVSLSGSEAEGERPLLTAQGMTARLKLWPLLVHQRVELDAIELHRPVIDLRANMPGLAEPGPSVAPQFRDALARPVPQNLPVAAELAVLPAATMRAFGIAEIRLRRATIRYGDDDARDVLENANLRATLPDVAAPLGLSGRFDWRGERIDISASLLSLRRLGAGEPTDLKFELQSPLGRAGFDGALLLARDTYQAQGQLSLASTNLPRLLGLLGARVAPALTQAWLDARLLATEGGFSLEAARLGLDDMTATGVLETLLGGERPRFKGSLAFDRLDMEKFRLSIATAQDTDTAGIRAGLIAPARAQPTGDADAANWKDLPIDLDMLKVADVDLAMTAASVSRKSLSGANGDMRIQLQDGEFTSRLAQIDLYGGQAQGDLSIDNSAGIPVISATFRLRGLEALPFFAAASGFDWLSGRLDADLTLASGGPTVGHLRRMARGQAMLQLSEGAIEGMDLPHMLARAQEGDFSVLAREAGAQTRITQLRAGWTLAEGKAQTTDLVLRGPMIGADGSGMLDLVAEKLDIRLQPRVTPRDGGEAQAIEIPIRIEGRWDSPKVTPDVALLLENPEKGVDAAKSFGRAVERFTGGRVSQDEFGRAIDSLFGKRRRGDQAPPEETGTGDAAAEPGDSSESRPGHRPFDAQRGY
jgi:AsmA protein